MLWRFYDCNPRFKKWAFPRIGGKPPKSSILNRIFHYKPSIFRYPYFGNIHILSTMDFFLKIPSGKTNITGWNIPFCSIGNASTQSGATIFQCCKVLVLPVRVYGCFQKEWYPQVIHFNRVFHSKPSILGYPYFWKHLYTSVDTPFGSPNEIL